MSNLFEGLKAGDLEELVLPLISIDEYESKLDDDSIVVAFYVGDKDPSQDLNRFIQKGAVSVLDTDVSPAPNEDGYYVVFVELLRDENFPKKLINILDSLDGLTSLSNWSAQIYDVDGVVDVSLETIQAHVRLQSMEDHNGHDDEVDEDLTEFFRASDLSNMVVEGKTVTLEARGVAVQLQFVDLGTHDEIVENNAVMGAATRLDESALHNCRKVQRLLGPGWIVEQRGDYLAIGPLLEERNGEVEVGNRAALFRL